jgi:hypothetical protein
MSFHLGAADGKIRNNLIDVGFSRYVGVRLGQHIDGAR